MTAVLDAPPASTPGVHDQFDLCIDAIAYAHDLLGSMEWLVTCYDPKADVG